MRMLKCIFFMIVIMMCVTCDNMKGKKYAFTFPENSREVTILLESDNTAIIESPNGKQQISWFHIDLGDLNYTELEFGKYGYIKDEVFYLSFEDMSAKRNGIKMRKIPASLNLYEEKDEKNDSEQENIVGQKQEKQDRDLTWLVGTWTGYNNRTGQSCVIVLKNNGHGSFLEKGGDYETVYILGDYYVSNNGRLCISGGKNKQVYFDMDKYNLSLRDNNGIVYSKSKQ